MPQAEQDKLRELQDKILQAKKNIEETAQVKIEHRNINYAWRMVLELVIGLVLGLGIGLVLDYWLGTAPLMIVIMSLFGFAAGIKTMIRTAAEFSQIETKNK
jgi:ATP synthase protein I